MTSEPSSAPTKSRWIWPFEILEQIGEGGMGVVYRARYVVNGRQVALKMLPGDVSDKTALARFEREVEVLKTLKHNHIVRCFGGVCEDKRRFYAMELLEGGSLEDQLVAKGKLPWELVIQYGLEMCSALEYSHEKGVVHRDVKPSNFLLSPAGQLKLSDFGLASVTATRKITAAGKTAGTFLYMAPEQIRGLDVTPRTDLYALGCVLYELVTGQVPFIGDTPGATLHLHCSAVPVRPTEKALDCPVLLEKVILKLLEKEPENRYQSAADVARDLRAVGQTVTVSPRAKPGSNVPVGYDQATRAMVDVQKKTSRLPQATTVVSQRALLICAGLLFLSCMWNGYQWSRLSLLARSQQLWVEALESPHPEVQRQAADSLGQMAARDSKSLKQLQARLQSGEPAQKILASDGLAQAGSAAVTALPQLIKLNKEDADPQVRDAAAAAISVIQLAEPDKKFPWLKVLLGLLCLASLGLASYFWLHERESAPPNRLSQS